MSIALLKSLTFVHGVTPMWTGLLVQMLAWWFQPESDSGRMDIEIPISEQTIVQ